MAEWLKNLSFSNVLPIVGGILMIIYALPQAAEKVFGSMKWYKDKKEEKEKNKKAELKALWEEFFQEAFKKNIEPLDSKIDVINEQITKLVDSSNDLLRRELVKIYYKYLPYRKIPIYAKQEFMKLYRDYHQQGGNTFIDEIYEEVVDWESVKDDNDIKR